MGRATSSSASAWSRCSRRSTSRAPRSRRASTSCSRSPTWPPRSSWSGSASCSSSTRTCSSARSISARSPTWGNFALGIAVGMVAYTGIETISNMSEEARDSSRTVPRGTGMVVAAVVGLYALLPMIALSAMPVTQNAAGELHDRARHHVRGRPGARDRREHRPQPRAHRRPARLRRDPRRGDPADRHQRRDDRAVAADLLDGPAPPAARDPARDPSRGSRRRTSRSSSSRSSRDRDAAGQDDVPGDDLRLRRDALVHGRSRLGDPATKAADRSIRGPSGTDGEPMWHSPVNVRDVRASRSRCWPCSAGSGRSARSSLRWCSTRSCSPRVAAG